MLSFFNKVYKLVCNEEYDTKIRALVFNDNININNDTELLMAKKKKTSYFQSLCMYACMYGIRNFLQKIWTNNKVNVNNTIIIH